jgi:hypothetical protein
MENPRLDKMKGNRLLYIESFQEGVQWVTYHRYTACRLQFKKYRHIRDMESIRLLVESHYSSL